jgi:hypothetical protein
MTGSIIRFVRALSGEDSGVVVPDAKSDGAHEAYKFAFVRKALPRTGSPHRTSAVADSTVTYR